MCLPQLWCRLYVRLGEECFISLSFYRHHLRNIKWQQKIKTNKQIMMIKYLYSVCKMYLICLLFTKQKKHRNSISMLTYSNALILIWPNCVMHGLQATSISTLMNFRVNWLLSYRAIFTSVLKVNHDSNVNES